MSLTNWTLDQLRGDDIANVRMFPATLSMPLAGVSLLGRYGSPRSYDDVLSPSTTAGTLDDALGGHAQSMIAGGHTHVQLLQRFEQRHFINPGSAGMPGISDANLDDRGITFRFHPIPIDMDALFADANAPGMPHLDWWKVFWTRPDVG